MTAPVTPEGREFLAGAPSAALSSGASIVLADVLTYLDEAHDTCDETVDFALHVVRRLSTAYGIDRVVPPTLSVTPLHGRHAA